MAVRLMDAGRGGAYQAPAGPAPGAAELLAPPPRARGRVSSRSDQPVAAREASMGLLEGKKALIFGVANDHSIAWGIAQALRAEGAFVGFSSIESLLERGVRPLAEQLGSTFG